MLLVLPLPVAHDPELEDLPDGAQLPADRALSTDVALARDALTRLGWRSGIYASGRGYIMMLLTHPITDAADAARTLAAAYGNTDAARAMQFNGADTGSFAVVDGADPAALFDDARTRHLHELIGVDPCVQVDEMVMDDLLADAQDGPVAQEVSRLFTRLAVSLQHASPDVAAPGSAPTLGDTLFS